MLFHVCRGWYVGCSYVCLCLCRLLLLLLLERLLALPELLKNVLVVQNRVRKLILENLTSKEIVDATLNLGHLKHLVDSWPLRRVSLQHCRH